MTLASNRCLFLLTLATALISLSCWIWPLDIWLSAPFFAGQGTAERFPLGQSVPVQLIYHLVPLITAIAAAVLGTTLLWRPMPSRWRHAWIVLALTLALGPGIVVNGIMKPFWGHPRPVAVVEFGGTASYLPPPLPAFGERARGFPSGHTAAASAALAPLFIWRRRRWLMLVCLGFIVFTAAGRLVAGGHFFSDLWWGFYLTYLMSWFAYHANRRWRLHHKLATHGQNWPLRSLGIALVSATLLFLPLDHVRGAWAAARELHFSLLSDKPPLAAASADQQLGRNNEFISTTTP